MAERYKVSIRVVSQKGTCSLEHKVGDQWIIDRKTPEGVCLGAFDALFPYLEVLKYGGAFPWEEIDRDGTKAACPDADNPVVFELRRLPE